MTDQHWEILNNVIHGKPVSPLPIGFIIDCPWLPNWYGINILDYFSNDELWLNANLKAVKEFPDVMFLPGFWSEFGMCTEPSAFGVRCTFTANEFPYAHKMINTADDIDALQVPNPKTDGLLPFMLNRLKLAQSKIEAAGHKIRFAVARGPLNVASYLMGSTEFLMMMMMQPEKAELLMKKITAFLKDWLHLQMETFPSIDGIFMLDDIIGFIGAEEFKTFGLPYFKELYDANVAVKFLHNDAPCKVSAPFLPDIGVNLFNMGFDVTLSEIKLATQNKVALVGNIPPRDVLASGTAADVTKAANDLVHSVSDTSRIIYSCGGGMPPAVSSENIQAFIRAVQTAAK
ncbi:MAG TPA: uroporphyrinogen decarboxylase family protein [Bacteroidota bacterium]|nr:uroporphyrinogen decarboxylase family protein [Bacteroidota bacterium]